ncbi:MAG: hypothetical protein MZW92_31370 [Comamonadaceae bacterium]|nr:hypothetical protein [Comamonadaceae bacterium]
MGMSEGVLAALDPVMEGDEIAVFGFYESRLAGENNDKIFSEFRITKVLDEIPESQTLPCLVSLCSEAGTSFGFFIDVDTTADEAYPKFARFKVPNGTDLPEFKEGDLVKATCKLTGKYGDMSIETFKDPLAPEFSSNAEVWGSCWGPL